MDRAQRHHAMVDFPQHQERLYVVLEGDHVKVEKEVERLSVSLLEIASVNPAQRGIEWAKSVAGHALGSGNELHRQWLAAFEECNQLRAEVEALRKDKARLDWFDRLNSALNKHYGTGYHWKVVVNHSVNRLILNQDIDMSDWHANGLRTCREAIDAAMSKEAGNG